MTGSPRPAEPIAIEVDPTTAFARQSGGKLGEVGLVDGDDIAAQ